MKLKKTHHQLDLELLQRGETVILFVKIQGELQHDDYAIIEPQLEQALEGLPHPQLQALFDVTELQGWTWHAAWDDLRLGLKHSRQFNRIALVGNKSWEAWIARLGQWFINGEVRYFEDGNLAQDWLLNA